MSSFKLVLKDQFGNVRTLQDNVEVSPSQPLDTQIWIDTTFDPPMLNVLMGKKYFPLVRTGATFVKNLNNIPTSHTIVKVELDAQSNRSLNILDNTMYAGQEIRVIIENTTTSTQTASIPNNGEIYKLLNISDTIDIDAKAIVVLDFFSDGRNIYINKLS